MSNDTTNTEAAEVLPNAPGSRLTVDFPEEIRDAIYNLRPCDSLPHIGKPSNLDPLQNVLYRNQYGTWTSIMVRALKDGDEWITSEELDILLANK